MFEVNTCEISKSAMGEYPLPIILPGLASGPKNSELEERALERFINSDVLPSSPTIGLDSVTWKAADVFSVVTPASPFAKIK